mmetsp:Transcript_65638/g.165389  ORF Transcript_65638/g.165389 Transcript_65638/m.165389 type:complete len:404 (-) Transcript_65638:179-1390(-)
MVQLQTAVLLFVVVILLLLLENGHHVVDHLDDLVETTLAQRLLARERHSDQVKRGALLGRRSVRGVANDIQGAGAQLRGARCQLDEAGASAWQCLFEQVKRVIVIKDFDGVGQGNKLLGPRLRAFLPFGGLRGAIRIQLLEEILVGKERCFRVGKVILRLHNVDPKVANGLGLGLYRVRESRHLLALGRHHLLVRFDGSLLLCRGVSEVLRHSVAHLLQDPSDLTGLRRISRCLRAIKEGQELLTVHVDHLLLALRQAAEHLSCVRLQEATGHTFFEGGDRVGDGSDIGVGLRLVGGVGCRLLLADGCRFGHGILRGSTVRLRLLKVLLCLRKAGFGGLNVRVDCRDLALGRGNARGEVAGARLAIAHELLVEFLFLLTLFLDLFLHGLQQGHDLPDGVHIHF